MIDPYATETKLLAISSPCGAPDYAAEMQLPEGKTCGDCAHCERCSALFGATPTNTKCDFWPSRFAQRKTSETMRRIDELADLLKRECGSLREVLAAVGETEGRK